MSINVPRPILTHAQRVCRLYKRAFRTMEDYQAYDRAELRYEACLLRHRFDETRKIKDMRVLAVMLEEAEKEQLDQRHIQPRIFVSDYDGIEHHRYHIPYDAIMDTWHPWEKAPYIDYFEKRENMKSDMAAYHDASIMKKGQIDLDKSEFPLREPPK